MLTDYDKATDTFYAADPAKNPAKRIKLSLTTRPHIDYFDTYWYYTSELKNKITTTNEVSSTPYIVFTIQITYELDHSP